MPPRCSNTNDLLNWQPPEVAIRHTEKEVQAATLKAQICKAVSLALEECDRSREEIAAEMTEYLGEDMSVNMLNAYSSQAREDHNISAVRLIALAVVTGDMRLFSIGPNRTGHVVVEERYLGLIKADQMRDQATKMRNRAAELADLAAVEERKAKGAR